MKANLRVDEAASELNTTRREIHRLIAKGELEAFLIGQRRGLRITSSSLQQLVRRRIYDYGLNTGVVYSVSGDDQDL